MPKGIPKSGHRNVKPRSKPPMVDFTIKLPIELIKGTTTKEKRTAMLIMFQNKIANESNTGN
jgi:hypothetical protein